MPLALAFAVLDLSGSAADLGLVLAALFTARVVFILAGGVWSDRLPRQLVMVAADLLRAAVHGVVAIAFFTDSIEVWHLIVSSARLRRRVGLLRPRLDRAREDDRQPGAAAGGERAARDLRQRRLDLRPRARRPARDDGGLRASSSRSTRPRSSSSADFLLAMRLPARHRSGTCGRPSSATWHSASARCGGGRGSGRPSSRSRSRTSRSPPTSCSARSSSRPSSAARRAGG